MIELYFFLAGLAAGVAITASWAEMKVRQIREDLERLHKALKEREPYRPGPWNNWGQE